MADAPAVAAHAFHSSLPGGRVGGTLRVFEHGLVFSRGDGGAGVTLPLNGLQLMRGGAANRLVFCTHPACPGWQVYTADHSFLTSPALAAHPALAAMRATRRRQHLRFWVMTVGGLAMLALMLVALWWSLDGISRLAARQVPASAEARLGETAIEQYRLGKSWMNERTSSALLAPLTDPLAAALPTHRYTLHFYIANDPVINAFALPGGYVVINSGLILQARDATELQGVLAHEISHVTAQHGIRAIIRSTGLFVVVQALLGDASGLVAVMASAAPMLINQKYSRDFEREADASGYDLLRRARIDPHGMVAFFRVVLAGEQRQLAQVKDARARQVMEATRSFLGTHPDTPERIATLEKKLTGEPHTGWRNDQAAFDELQAAVRHFVSDTRSQESQHNEK
ncbi:MAG TPA: M48 family metallopeptidase [Moraxellaceae bacterium]|nr:M48 family metallopeptidase [Moraxellaceae bacterium]